METKTMTDEAIVEAGRVILKGIMQRRSNVSKSMVRPSPSADWDTFAELTKLEAEVEGHEITATTIRKSVVFCLGHTEMLN